jgi:oligopeptide/dipeptide ABC transporter ATP-binding protein
MSSPLLDVKNLETSFFTKQGVIKAVSDVSFSISPGETLGIVGESGCGKSVTSFSVLGLLSHPGRVTGGQILFKGSDLLKLDETGMQRVRGKHIAMIFQEPMTALNPVLTIGKQISEQILAHENVSTKDAWNRSVELLNVVGIPSPEKRVSNYPHQLSGGMRQRAMIAMALSCNPELLIADEPTTALDVTIQAQILDLLQNLQEKLGMAVMFITHDLGVISEISDRVIVMYAGKVVEQAPAAELFKQPRHPYTAGLLRSIPSVKETHRRLTTIEGVVPSLLALPQGCRFRNRCAKAQDKCAGSEPPLVTSGTRAVACWYPEAQS